MKEKERSTFNVQRATSKFAWRGAALGLCVSAFLVFLFVPFCAFLWLVLDDRLFGGTV